MADDEAASGGGTTRKRAGGGPPPAKKAATTTRKLTLPVAKAAPATAPVKKVAPARTVAAKAPAKRAGVKRAPANAIGPEVSTATAPAAPPVVFTRRVGATSGARPAANRLAAEQTFDDDWDTAPPPPKPRPDDPAERIRAVLRSAAAGLRAQDGVSARTPPVVVSPTPAPRTPGPAPAPVPAPPAPAAPTLPPVAEVLVAPKKRVLKVRPGAVATRKTAAPEPEWDAAGQPADDEPPVDRIPDAMDFLELPEVHSATPKAPPISAPPPWTPPTTATPKAKRSRRGVLVAVIVAVLAAVGAGVFGLIAARDPGVDYSKLKVGDCFDSSATNEVRSIKVKPCSMPHNSEVFLVVTHPAGRAEPYPGKDALVQFAADACLAQPLTDYLGTPLDQSKFKDFEIVPQASAWKDGRRLLVCGIDTGGASKVTGSAKK